jgi:DNA-binding CsgD family transcriptional regulator
VDSQRRRAAERIASLSLRSLDVVDLWRATTPVLHEVLPHHWSPCWYTLDPENLLITSHHNEEMPEFPPEWLTAEYVADDVNQLAAVALSDSGISTLHDATDGHPERSERWHENMRLGGDQELVAALRDRRGATWGAVGIYRAPGAPLFDSRDKEFVRAIAPHLAAGVRRALLLAEAAEPDVASPPGMLVVDKASRLVSATDAGREWLAELDSSEESPLPSSVLAACAAARDLVTHAEVTSAPTRLRTRRGSWLEVHVAPLQPAEEGLLAVVLEPAHPGRLHPLLAAAHDLTPREQHVLRLVLAGAATDEIAQELVVSPHTVKQHLKTIYAKTGSDGRRDLVGRVFFRFYEPRLRDNERRTAQGQPIRGGPMTPPP